MKKRIGIAALIAAALGSALFGVASAITFESEGAACTNHPDDLGGRTGPGGVTERLARAYGYEGDICDLTEDEVRGIVYAEFWAPNRLDEVGEISPDVALEVFDTAYNIGNRRAVRILQDCLNAVNRQGRDFADVTVDGYVGPSTLDALRRYHAVRPGTATATLVACQNGLQVAYYVAISQARPQNESFTNGWIYHRTR